jgi:hypothetical protein
MPNPFMEQLNVILKEDHSLQTAITLIDIHGQVVLQHIMEKQTMSHQFKTSDLPLGVYMLVIQQGDKRKIIKTIKE